MLASKTIETESMMRGIESMDVGDSFGVDDTKLLAVGALEGRESLVVIDCLVLGGINPELQHAFTPK